MTTQHTPEQPKPCPHCGGEPRWIHHSNNFAGEALMSLHCCASVLGSRAYVLAKWNTRLLAEQQRDDLLAALKEIAEYPRKRGHEFTAAGLRSVAKEAIAKARGQQS